MNYSQAINFIVKRRNDEVAAANAFYRALMQDNEQFRLAELAVRSAELEYAKGKVSREVLSGLYRKRNAIVSELGVKNMLSPKPHCELCNDTGWVSGKICVCAKRLALNSNDEFIAFPLHTFDDIDYSLFKDEKQKAFTQKVVKALSTISRKGKSAKIRNINLLGNTGTGKTFLASCFAGEASASGQTVVFITAFNLVERARVYHTTFDSSRESALQPLLDCDILAVDDLGTETMLNNITKEYLYLVINERQIRGKTTLITSNLTIDEIGARYGERIASRLFNKQTSLNCEFCFSDIRKTTL